VLSLEITIFAFATCATPGPVNIVASIAGARSGLKANIPFVLGATLGLSLVIIISGFGLSQIVKTNELLTHAITLVGSLYILYLAFLMSRKPSTIKTDAKPPKTTSFYQGATLQVVNPKAWLVSLSGLAMYLNQSNQSIFALYVFIFFVACFLSVFLWVGLGQLISAKLNINHQMIFNRSMAALLMLLVLFNLIDMLFSYIR
jgi:threonine/homoserine/homoserine lactone efflux protein